MRCGIALAFVLLLAPALSAEDAPALTAELEAFFAESDPGARAALGMALTARRPDSDAVADALPGVRRWAAEPRQGPVVEWKRPRVGGGEHTIYACVPETYDAARAWPVLIWLHGAVSRPVDEGGAFGIRTMLEIAQEEGFFVLSPSTQAGSEWWTPNGVEFVRGALDDLAREWRIDADRVAVTGFSDGASGCFHLLAHDPERYACFLPLMAHPGITRMIGGPCFAANVRSRPVLAFNGGADPLYPSERIKPLIDELKAAGANMEWVDLPDAGHRVTTVLPEHWPRLRAFWQAHPRAPEPERVAWETALPRSEGRHAWIEILAVDETAPSAEGAVDERLADAPGRPRLGISLNQEYVGAGLGIREVEAGTAAADAGFRAGDVILAVDGATLEGENVTTILMGALAKMTDRDGTFDIQRGEERLTLRARPRVAAVAYPPGLGYGEPSGRIVAVRGPGQRIDVTTRHVRRFKLHLTGTGLDLSKPVEVYVNGQRAFSGVATKDTGYVLQQAARAPLGPVYRAFIVVG
ncbi:MAG: PDZ domain-containing protein [Planctomycetota bacterium]|nr:PDZ domain-containing protein [Planctomycetota bacterium]